MGFGAEIKDFLAAFQVGQRAMTSLSDAEYKRARAKLMDAQSQKALDPERAELEKDVFRARASRLRRGPMARPLNPAAEDALRARTDYYRLRQEQLKRQMDQKPPSAADDLPALPAPPGRQSALDLEEEDLTQFANKGGYIRKVKGYADGGLVEEDDYEDTLDDSVDDADVDIDDDEVGAIPASAAPANPAGKTKVASTKVPAARGYSVQAGHDGVLEGLKFAQKATGSMEEGAIEVSSQRRMGGQRAYLMGAGGDVNELAEVRKKIDPEGKMSESERNLASVAHVYDYYVRQGSPEKAQRAAATLVQTMRQVASRYQAIAAAAAEKGDVDGTLNALMKAHANIPDGRDLKVSKDKDGKITYSMVDTQSGKTVEKGVATPDELLRWASRGTMNSFDDAIVAAGGQRAGGARGARPPREDKVRSLEDREEALKPIEEAAKARPGTDKDLSRSINHLASQIVSANDMLPEDALDVVKNLTTVGVEPNFKTTKTEGGGVVATMQDGREVRLPKDAWNQLVVLQGKARVKYDQMNREKAEKEAREGKRRGLEADRLGATSGTQTGAREREIEAAMPSNERPLRSYGALGDIRERAMNYRPSAPAPAMSELERVNAARRAAGLPPIDPSKIPMTGSSAALPLYD